MAVTIKEALACIFQEASASKSNLVPLESALGRTSAKTLKATIALPTFNNSAMDGFGISGEHESYTIVGKILAGDAHSYTLKSGECVRIMTGAEVPDSVETVIPQENTNISDTSIMIHTAQPKHANIRYKGEDIDIDETIIKQGETITPAHISLLASQGSTHVEVYRKPRVAVFSSGSELKLHFEKLEKSQIYNSNTPYLISRSKALGCETIFAGKAKDSVEALQTLIKASLDCDLIVTSGGASVGEADFTQAAFEGLGLESFFSKVNIKPGKPTSFGKIGNTLVLNLPGNPFAASINFEIFGKLIIIKLKGERKAHHGFIQTKMGETFKTKRPIDTVVPGLFNGESFTPAQKFAPGNVNVLNHCNGMIIIDKEKKILQEGDAVKFIPIEWDFLNEELVNFIS